MKNVEEEKESLKSEANMMKNAEERKEEALLQYLQIQTH